MKRFRTSTIYNGDCSDCFRIRIGGRCRENVVFQCFINRKNSVAAWTSSPCYRQTPQWSRRWTAFNFLRWTPPKNTDTAPNGTCRIITGGLKNTTVENAYVPFGTPPSDGWHEQIAKEQQIRKRTLDTMGERDANTEKKEETPVKITNEFFEAWQKQ